MPFFGSGFGVGTPGTGSLKGINVTAEVKDWADFSTTSTTFVDVTGATVDIVLTKTCTIYAFAVGVMGISGVAGDNGAVQLLIGGTESGIVTTDQPVTGIVQGVPYCIVGRKTGVAAATVTVKIQAKVNVGTATCYAARNIAGRALPRIVVIAIEE